MTDERYIVIGSSWPYANNDLHFGYIASSLSSDILARYHRMKGDHVLLVSGTDSHGTKFEMKAREEGCTPKEIVDRYHSRFVEALRLYDFSFDLYSITYNKYHEKKVQEMVLEMYKNGYIYEKVEKRPFCPHCNRFVVDTEVSFICPVCGKESKGDNCSCGYVPVEKDFENAKCLICGHKTEQREQKVLVFKLTAFKDKLQKLLDENRNIWRQNSINETQKYLNDLCDRDFSRELSWGVDIPIKGYEDKKIWVWYEALLGYVTDVMQLGEEKGFNWEDYWKTTSGKKQIIYMCHGKDNIVFHSLILPAMLIGIKQNFNYDIRMVSAEYLTANGKKISKSDGNNIDTIEMVNKYGSDSLRYYFAGYGPEKKDSDFTVEVYSGVHNGEIVNKFGNLINRTLKFKGLEILPDGKVDVEMRTLVNKTYDEVSKLIEALEFKKATGAVMDLVSAANKFYDDKKPWALAKEDDKSEFNNVIFTCAYIIANLSNLFEPIMPKSCEKIRNFLNLCKKPEWKEVEVASGISLDKVEPLFSRI